MFSLESQGPAATPKVKKMILLLIFWLSNSPGGWRSGRSNLASHSKAHDLQNPPVSQLSWLGGGFYFSSGF
jgi:hypothetical protein